MKSALLAAVLALGCVGNAFAQGLVDLAEKPSSNTSGSGGLSTSRSGARLHIAEGRLDLSLSPDVRALLGEPGTRSINLGASAQWNPVCGKFDLKADFKALLGKEAREEYLEGFVMAGVGELLGSGMELMCQSMPTACSILQNNNIAANLKLLYSNDLCRSMEDAVLSGSRRGRAEAIHRCMERKLSEGKTKDEASRACLRENHEITGFDGRVVTGELDLNREIRKYVSFTDGGSKLLDDLTQERRLGMGTVSEDVRPNALAERFDSLRERYLKAWTEALEKAKGAPVEGGASVLKALVPPGAPPVTGVELALLARRSPGEVEAFLASVSSAAALLGLTRELNEVERKLEALKTSPALEGNEEHTGYLESLLGRLRAERERLLRLYADQERFAQVLSAGRTLGQAEVAKTRLDALGRALLRETSIEHRIGTRAFGTPDGFKTPLDSRKASPSTARSTQGAACDNCGMEYSIGTGGRP